MGLIAWLVGGHKITACLHLCTTDPVVAVAGVLFVVLLGFGDGGRRESTLFYGLSDVLLIPLRSFAAWIGSISMV